MKARVIETGEIVDVYESCSDDFPWTDAMGDKAWKTEELMFLENIENNFDYWTRLEHQYAGMAMQGILANHYITDRIDVSVLITEAASTFAKSLVEKVREENPKELEGLKKELEALKTENTILENKVKLLKEERK